MLGGGDSSYEAAVLCRRAASGIGATIAVDTEKLPGYRQRMIR